MIDFPISGIIEGVAMETMNFHIAHTKLFFRTTLFRTQGVPMKNLAPMKNCPRVGGLIN